MGFRLLKIMKELICIFLLLGNFELSPSGDSWTFLSELHELCPYTSFCENDSPVRLPDNDTRRPCCASCSCKPECEEYGNCCFDGGVTRKDHVIRKCTSPVVSRAKIPTTNYIMIHSCSKNSFLHQNSTICLANDADKLPFAPVISLLTGEIYVNSACALCNNITDFIPWKLAVKCPTNKEDHSFDTLRLLQGEDLGLTGCHLSYVPPIHLKLESRECVADAIRECNVSGRNHKWEPFWNYCPLFNATISNYGNIFCMLCNYYSDKEVIMNICEGGDSKQPFSSSFTVFLSGINFEELKVTTMAPDIGKNKCKPTEAYVESFKTECRPIICPRGQIEIGGKCGYYSKEWIGGPFIAALKLSPLDKTRTIDRNLIADMQPELKHDKKARWLTRNAMRAWNIDTLYRPSADKRYAEYIVALASYPSPQVNPSRLQKILRRTLKETWLFDVENTTIHLNVQFNKFDNYFRIPKGLLLSGGIVIDEDYGYVSIDVGLNGSKDWYLLEVNFQSYEKYDQRESVSLNIIFLCEQVELQDHEYVYNTGQQLLVTLTNETLYESEYRITESGHFSVCLDRLPQNKGSNMVCNVQLVSIALAWIEMMTK